MKKRILCLFLTALMLLSAVVTVSAETDAVTVPATLQIAAVGSSSFGATATSYGSTPDSATFKLRCVVDMSPVRDAYTRWKTAALESDIADVAVRFSQMKTTGTVMLTIAYTNAVMPDTVTLPSDVAQNYKISLVNTSTPGQMTIKIETKEALSVERLEGGALEDMVLELNGVKAIAFDQPMTITGSMQEGTSHTQRVTPGGELGTMVLDVTYTSPETTVTATAKKTTSGTPASPTKKYTLTFDVDGDTSLVSSIRRDEDTELKSADFKIPHKDGYVFKGWFLDQAMTEAVGETLTLTQDMTLYGHFEKSGSPAEEISGKLETDDHFAYVSGYPDGTVRPEANITREETAMMFYRLLTADYRATVASKTNNFSDVNADRWSNDAISTLVNAGLLSGYPEGTFEPGEAITRAEFATLVARFVGVDETATHSFTDLGGHWSEKYVATAVKRGWLAGYDDGTFNPEGKIKRAEAMTLVNRILYRFANEKGMHADAIKWPDNDVSKWYYYAVQEATNGHEYTRQDDGVYENWLALQK